MVRFTFRHFLANPWFPRLLAVENLQNARFLKQIKDMPAINSPLVAELREILKRGPRAGHLPHRRRPDAALHLDRRRWAISTSPT